MSTGSGQPLGGPAEEARRLVEALGDWASTKLGTVDQQISTGAPECQVCPVCQLIAALRGDGPDVVSRLGEAWSAFLAVLTEHSHPSPDPGAAPEPGQAPASGDIAPSGRRVQNIDVR